MNGKKHGRNECMVARKQAATHIYYTPGLSRGPGPSSLHTRLHVAEAHLDSKSQWYYLLHNDAAVRARPCRVVAVAAAILVGLAGDLCRCLRTFGGTSSKIAPRRQFILPRGSGRTFAAGIVRGRLLAGSFVPSRYRVTILPCAYPVSV